MAASAWRAVAAKNGTYQLRAADRDVRIVLALGTRRFNLDVARDQITAAAVLWTAAVENGEAIGDLWANSQNIPTSTAAVAATTQLAFAAGLVYTVSAAGTAAGLSTAMATRHRLETPSDPPDGVDGVWVRARVGGTTLLQPAKIPWYGPESFISGVSSGDSIVKIPINAAKTEFVAVRWDVRGFLRLYGGDTAITPNTVQVLVYAAHAGGAGIPVGANLSITNAGVLTAALAASKPAGLSIAEVRAR